MKAGCSARRSGRSRRSSPKVLPAGMGVASTIEVMKEMMMAVKETGRRGGYMV